MRAAWRGSAACRTGSLSISTAHHVETVHWGEVVKYIDDPVIRDQAMQFHQDRHGAPPYGLNGDLGLRYQGAGGRIPHQEGIREKTDDPSVHRDVTLTRRAMDSLGVDVMVVFPTPMLFLGLHPQPEMEVWLCRAYNRWMAENPVVGGRSHQVSRGSALQYPVGGRARRAGNGQSQRCDRVFRSLHPAQTGAS